MSSSIIPGSIPLPPQSDTNGSNSGNGLPSVDSNSLSMQFGAASTATTSAAYGQIPKAGVLTTPATPYDAQTLAYYQAYYQQPAEVQQYQQYYNCFAGGAAAAAQAAASQQQASSLVQTHENGNENNEEEEDEDDPTIDHGQTVKASNVLPVWGNEKTMNLNPLLLTNIQNSPYFKVTLFALKTYHEVIDEIWYNVKHLEPWERGSRKTAGQTGMCGSVRGVGAGGIVSTPFCILFKLYTLRLTRKQLMGLLRHKDTPFIRAIGFLYLRFSQPPETLWSWCEKFLTDDEEFEPSASGGQPMSIGGMCRHILGKLDWYGTLFPRIPVPVQKKIKENLDAFDKNLKIENEAELAKQKKSPAKCMVRDDEDDRRSRSRSRHRERNRERTHDRNHDRQRRRSRSPRERSHRGRDDERRRSRDKDRGRDYKRRSRSRDRTRERRRSRSGERDKRR